MGSSSSSYAPKSIYLDVDGKVQKVDPILTKKDVFIPIELFPFLIQTIQYAVLWFKRLFALLDD